MATGTKRDHSGNPRAEEAQSGGRFHAMFERFRDELDEHHDRRERVIKASRDVTAQSKKMIFALQRTETLNQPLPQSIAQEVEKRMSSITKLLTDITPT
ncbi:translin-associated protein X [Ophiocordyceps camponoti-floridani]|uniref:Translin-associated protein X n=1 Tax=Ophiocordyceps camponoti-floridani TaxID=2030778 RepID=A0A8H4QA99_9HYPO|nr:translin-associated protein X [Ophiocordyceps camponoti-floridani]